LGEFDSSRKYARHGVQIWRSGSVQFPVAEEIQAPFVNCLVYEAMCDWHFGEIASCHALMGEAISTAKELNDTNALALTLFFAACLSAFEHNPAEAARVASSMTELSGRQGFVQWLAVGSVFRGWARSASGNALEGIRWIEQGIRDVLATGTILFTPFLLALKAEALHLANHTTEALEVVGEAEALAERSEERWWCAELRRLNGVFLAAIGAEENQIEASFCGAIRIAKEQKSVSLQKRTEATYAEYRRQKGSALGPRRFGLPLC
jgi:adenylate cyclase